MKLGTTIAILFVIQISQSNCLIGGEINILRDIYKSMSNTLQIAAQNLLRPFDWTHLLIPKEECPPPCQTDPEYDFIIVGSGSAGSVLANRLSEISDWKILLLEAGKGENQLTRIPIIAPVFQFTHYDWQYVMERQENLCMGLVDQRMAWPRGRALGGSTVINYMIYTRGNPIDYDRWEQAGNPGWSYKDVLPYFLKSERANLRSADYRYHNRNGNLYVEDVYQSPLVRTFIKAGNELGLPTIDYNSPEHPFGISTMQGTVRKGQRYSAYRAFLSPAKSRKNLRIMTSAYVTKVLIDPGTKTAYGVNYERYGKKYTVRAKKEVILSAGAFNSPQLLMLAGVGPKEHLEELGIPLLKDLPVGQNLQDHISYPPLSFSITKGTTINVLTVLTPESLINYTINGNGPINTLGGVEGIAYIKTEVSKDNETVPDIEIFFTDGALNSDYGLITRRTIRMKDEVYDALFRPYHNKPVYTITPMLLHPKSVGHLKLRSRNPKDYPLFYGNFFTDPEDQDIRTLLAAIRYIQKLSNTKAFQERGAKILPGKVPGCEKHEDDSDDYWLCALRSLSSTLHHQLGTAKMGPESDKSTVVNHELKVHGIKRLRVADCSVIPFALSSHTNAPALMIGEKASDIIKAEWKNKD